MSLSLRSRYISSLSPITHFFFHGRKAQNILLLKESHEKARLSLHNASASRISSLFTEEKVKLLKKRTPFSHGRNSEEIQGMVHGLLSLLRAQKNQKIIKALWSSTYCPVSETSGSLAGHGSSNRIMAKNIHLKASENRWEENNGVLRSGLLLVLILIQLYIYRKSWNQSNVCV